MENFATRIYDSKVSKKVKEELEIAKIPVFVLPSVLDSEVKTEYIGILNGFKFYRAWTYWVCKGDMPLEIANYIYENYKDLQIRAGGHCGNVEPEKESYNPIYTKELSDLLEKVGFGRYMEQSKDIIDDPNQPRFVATYHIDTQQGLCKIAEIIRERDIHTDMFG
ncbi:MAG: hypothetical protein ACLRPD_12210 [Megamonas funiformis]|uniref:hypothetical protein n=1 Tax=Megamonas funiformis TaxID=437897 RepID=UPI003990B472